MTSAPALGSLRGEPITGDWTLHIQDLASQDEGTLKKWTLDMAISGDLLFVEDTESILIPDKNPDGVTKTLPISPDRPIRDLVISVDITHTWVGDLRVTLIAPDGTAVHLVNRQGGDSDNLVKTWHPQDNR